MGQATALARNDKRALRGVFGAISGRGLYVYRATYRYRESPGTIGRGAKEKPGTMAGPSESNGESLPISIHVQ